MNEQPALFIGIDWADQKHDIYVIDRNGKAPTFAATSSDHLLSAASL